MKAGRLSVFLYTGCVSVVGIASLVVLTGDEAFRPNFVTVSFALLLPYVVVGELFPLRIPRRDDIGEITVSTTFAFAILLVQGTVAAMLALAVSSVIADLWKRKPLWKVPFNAAQMSLSLLAAGVTLDWLAPGGSPLGPIELSTSTLPAALVAAAVFFVVNIVFMYPLVSLTAPRLRAAGRWGAAAELLLRGLPFQALTAAVLLSLSPIVAAAAEHSPALIPLFAIPMLAVYASVQIYLQREHQVLHDALTGLPNRALFRERVRQAIEAARRRGGGTAVMVVDLDNFKEVNDTLGHATGDRLLVEVAERLRVTVSGTDTVARPGVDEFMLATWDAGDLSTLLDSTRAVRSVIEQPIVLGGVTLAIEGSVGVALWPEHGATADDLIRNADTAMHVAKRQRSGFRVYVPEDADRVSRRMRLIADLRVAIDDGELELHYQPKAALATREVTGVEALLRWRRQGRLVPPDQFIPAAEQTGLMGSLTRYVLRTALAQASTWHRKGIRMPVAVNISARDLQDPDLPGDIGAMLTDAQVAPEWLELEVTESSIMDDVDAATRVLSQLRSMGVTLAIDDFGTGHTSLAHLPRLPVHVLKIDKSFVINLDGDTDDPIVRTTIDLGHSLGLKVVAEGVESELIWGRLDEMGCHVAQGYHLSAPVSAPDLESWLRGDRGPASGTGKRSS